MCPHTSPHQVLTHAARAAATQLNSGTSGEAARGAARAKPKGPGQGNPHTSGKRALSTAVHRENTRSTLHSK